MITHYEHDEKNRILKQSTNYKSAIWTHAQSPSSEEINFLAEKFYLDVGHITDGLDENEVPRFEIEGKLLYLFIRFPHVEDVTTVTLPFLIVVGEKHIITISLHSPVFLSQLVTKKITFNAEDKKKVLLFIFSEITNLYYHYLNRINKEIRQISRAIEKIKNKNIVQFVGFEAILNDFRPSLMGTDSVLNFFLSDKFLVFNKNDRDALEDIHLTNRQIIESCNDTLESIKNIREAYTTILTNNLNRVIKFFTSVTVILTIPTMIASLYGMNVALPYAQHPHAFLWILSITLGISIGLLFVFQKKDWF